MPYAPTTWEDSPSTATPITAAELNRMEAGIDAAIDHAEDADGASHTGKLNVSDIDDTPVNGETSAPISSNWAFDHAAATATHGVTGAIVGTTDVQELSSKTLTNYKETLHSATTSGDVTIDLANGNVQRFILDAARQFTMPADPGAYGQSFVLIIECATFTPTWAAAPTIEWLTSDGAAPTLVTTANLVNVLTFIWDDVDGRWLGFLAGSETA